MTLCVCCAGPAYSAASHAVTLTMDEKYASALVNGDSRRWSWSQQHRLHVSDSFREAYAAGVQRALDVGHVKVTEINFAEEFGSRRSLQSSDPQRDVTINYIVICAADGCASERSKLETINKAQMTKIIDSVDAHAVSTGFGQNAVSKTALRNSLHALLVTRLFSLISH